MKNDKIEKCEEYVRLDRISLSRENQELSSNLLAKTKEFEMSEESLSNMFKQLKDLLDNIIIDIDSLYLGKLQSYDVHTNNLVEYLNNNYLDLIKEIKGIEE